VRGISITTKWLVEFGEIPGAIYSLRQFLASRFGGRLRDFGEDMPNGLVTSEVALNGGKVSLFHVYRANVLTLH
jgi:hypothetical protein